MRKRTTYMDSKSKSGVDFNRVWSILSLLTEINDLNSKKEEKDKIEQKAKIKEVENKIIKSTSKEKKYCIKEGAITILIQCLCFFGKKDINNDTILEITQLLIDNSHQDSRLFCKQLLFHLDTDIECTGISNVLTKIVNIHPLRSIIVEDLCIPKLLEIYYKCSLALANIDFQADPNIYINSNPNVNSSNINNNNSIATKSKNDRMEQFHSFHNLTIPCCWENGNPPPLPTGFNYQNLLLSVPTPKQIPNSPPMNSVNGHRHHHQHQIGTNNSHNNNSDSPNDSPVISGLSIGGGAGNNSNRTGGNNYVSLGGSLMSSQLQQQQQQQLNMSLNVSTGSITSSSIGGTPSNLSLPTSPPIQSSSQLKLSISKPFIPKLNLPIRVENSAKMTRSSRRRDDSNSSTRSQIGDVKIETTATKELSDLATKLGETYMTSDLTALISYKQVLLPSMKRLSMAPKKLGALESNQMVMVLDQSFKDTKLYKVRCDILKTLISSTSYNLWLFQFGNNPINILYSESILLHKGVIPSEKEHLELFYKLASNWSDYVEYIHRKRWNDVTKGMISERKATFRKKLDLMLWRINSSITIMLDTYVFTDMEFQLCALAKYMENCPSRIISSQVVDVCIESLLKLKHYVFHGKVTSERVKDIHIIHYLLCVFDEIIIHNMHPPLNELLLAIFIERDDTFNFIRHYTTQVLSSESIEKEFTRCYPQDPKKSRLIEIRCRAIRHHTVCIEMLKRNFDPDTFLSSTSTSNFTSYSSNINSNSNNNSNSASNNNSNNGISPPTPSESDLQHGSDLLKKMEYLLLPNGGIILPFLQNSPSFTLNFEIKKYMLEFLSKVFLFKRNPFTKKKLYIDSYISYIYISFIKLYNSFLTDSQTLTLCKLFLGVLIAFSVNKNDKISMKFYQLRTMDFLVREVNLEYEVKQSKEVKSLPFLPNKNLPQTTTTTTTSSSAITSNGGGNSSNSLNTSTNSTTSTMGISKPSLPMLKLPSKLGPSSSPTTLSASVDSTTTTPSPSTHPPPLNLSLLKSSSDNNSDTISSTNSSTTTTPITKPSTPPVIIPKINIPLKTDTSTIKKDISPSATTTTTTITASTDSTLSTKPIIPALSRLPSKPLIPSLTSLPTKTPTIPLLNVSSGVVPTTTTNNNNVGLKISIPKLTLPAIKTRTTESEVQQSLSDSNTSSPPIVGGLSAMTKKMNPNDIKFQLVLDNPAQSSAINNTANDDESGQDTEPEPTENEISNENQRYQKERNQRKLYKDTDLHIAVLQLIFSLLLNSNQTLEHSYSDQFPIVAKKLNVPFILHMHINHPDNEKIIPELTTRTHEMGPNHFRILKLLFSRLYHSSLFKDLKRVAKGAYGTVYKGTLGNEEGLEIAVKLMPVPKSIHDRCVLHDIFTEILIMDTFKNDPRQCHMFDYGVDGENYWIVMKSYKCSLKEWRVKQTQPFLRQLPLYLNIYMDVLLTAQFLAENKINHFDIKCDNFLVHPKKKGTLDEDFWNQATNDPNFTVCMADWGEAKVYSKDIEGYTTRNRGTEFIKSPEMLTVAYASQKTRENFDRRKKVGSNTASDVWSLGCLFFELLTGDFLFYDDDWVKFFIRVTQADNNQLITAERKAKYCDIPAITDFFDYVFVRDPFYRPTLKDLLAKFNTIKPTILAQLEQLVQELDSNLNNNSTQPKLYYNGGDGTRYKSKVGVGGHYTPGRFHPHTAKLSLATNTKSTSTIGLNEHIIDSEEAPEFPAHKHFMDTPSLITPYMYISSFQPSLKKNMLINTFHITHIINCTGSPNAFPDHFEYLHLQLHDNNSQDILHSLVLAFDFIRDAIMHHGKVLIVSDKGVSRSAALAIGYFMDSRSISYFEAFLLIRDRRYIVQPNPGFVEQLCRWGKQRRTQKGLAESWGGGDHYSTSTTQYQCLCGACVFTLLSPFDSTKFNNPKQCNCTANTNPTHSLEDCPNFLGCSNFLNDMKKLHNYNSRKSVYWGYINITNVVGDYKRSSIEIKNPIKGKKEWELYKCKTCQFLTYATNTSSSNQQEKLIAIVTNLKTSELQKAKYGR
ncbi:hypothetical protein CYY_005379 [Polysphondylium violaceum]|uniref:Uncharacterized protein n=1 Tax=Polysphondylium violaceum TaxID=133409 RepID=A0A8J4PU11_9MYCE|nr:hypothetical protein CYY_005379 [Polysphondylium violaceum]